MSSRLDLIIFGATGFTGKYAIEELVNITSIDPSITWGIAGRSQIKLEKVIQDVEKKNGVDLSKIKIFLADVSDPESLTNMTKQAKVLVNCCGPYRFYGEAVVKACVETMTSHVDVSGEPAYMEKMQLEYSEAAEKAGVYIVSACGFDSIPADMGVVFMQQQFKGQLNGVESYIGLKTDPASRRWGEASIHYGTWESLVYGIAKQSELAPLRRKLYPVKLPCFTPKLKSRSIIHKSSMDGRWYLPFPGSDASVVYRSQRFFYEKDKQRPLYMKPYFGLPSFFHIIPVILMAIILGVMSMFSFGRKILLKHPRIFSFGVMSHEGPSELAMKNTDFSMDLYGQGWDESVKDIEAVRPNKTIHVKVAGINPGYGTTNITLLFSAITILRESDKMPGNGGVFPPGYAFAKTSLIEKLNANNVTFEVIEQKMINQ